MLVLACGEPVGISLLGVRSPEDASRLRDELGERWTSDELRTALGQTWNELNEKAKAAS